MRNQVKVYDVDTHINPSADALEPYLASVVRELIPNLDEYKVTTAPMGYNTRTSFNFRKGFGAGMYGDIPRVLGEAAPREGAKPPRPKFMGRNFPSPGGDFGDAKARIHDMDEEGIDIQMMVPTIPGGAENPAVDLEFIRASHRFLDDFCNSYPQRFKSVLLADARFIEESVAEIKRWGRCRWAAGVWLDLPIDFPLDHPDLNPIWTAIEEEGLCVVHHSFATGYPGYRDLWKNPFLGRTANHPWSAMRTVAAFFGSGIMDRYPTIRLCILESGFGWLPFWAKRMDDQVIYLGSVAEDLQHTMSEYMTGGRFFAGIVLHEGEEMVKMVSDLLGDHILMFGSDYPHPECRFPDSVDITLGWKSLAPERLKKLMWENAARCFGEP